MSNDITLLAGRKIKRTDIEGKKNVIMVSDKAVASMFDGNSDKAAKLNPIDALRYE